MDEPTRRALSEILSRLWCPSCHSGLEFDAAALACGGCDRRFEIADRVVRMFVPSEESGAIPDGTDDVKACSVQTPGRFAAQLDEQLAPGLRVLEWGCGTGQLSNSLAIANRTVVGVDVSLDSLAVGEAFRRKNKLDRVNFLQTNIFRPVFMPESFDVVISNGVLHRTSDPFLAFRTIAGLVRPGGHILIADARRWWFRYNTIGQVMGWLDRTGLEFVNSVPRTKLLLPSSGSDRLFTAKPPGGRLERLLVELRMAQSGSREGGFFAVIGRKPASLGALQAKD